MSLLQWTSKAISHLESNTLKPIPAPENLPDSPAGDTWSEYRAYLAAVLPHSKMEDIGSLSSRGLHWVHRHLMHTLETGYAAAARNYLTFAESVLRAHGATLPEGASTLEQPVPVTPQGPGYIRLGKYTTTPVPIHLKVFYDELYEACWKGDNASIRELCLPKQVAEGKEPIQIQVVMQSPIASASVIPSGTFTGQCCPCKIGCLIFLS